MNKYQKYGIKYPFTSDNDDNIFLDLNNTEKDSIKSQVLHVIFTPKGQKIRDPEFGTDMIKYVFSQNDNVDVNELKNEISRQIKKYVPSVEFRDFGIYRNEGEDNSVIVRVEYMVKVGNNMEITTLGVKL